MSPSEGYAPRPFSRQWWSETARTFLWVAVITLLIWIYADMKFTDTRKFSMVLALSADKADLELLGQDRVDVEFELQGSRESLDRLERQLPNEHTQDISEYGAGAWPVPTGELLQRVPELGQAGVRVLSASPQVITLQLDRRANPQVEVIPGELVGAEGKLVEIRPAQVTVSVAQSTWDRIQRSLNEKGEQLRLQTASVDLSNEQQDTTVVKTVPINPVLGNERVRVAPQQVDLTIQVTHRTAEKTLLVNVRPMFPPTWFKEGVWQSYDFVPQEGEYWYIKEIRVSGPKQSIDMLKSEDVDAYLRLTEEDRSQLESWRRGVVQVRFPRTMPNLKLEGESLVVNYKLIRRSSPPLAVPAPAAAVPALPLPTVPTPAVTPTAPAPSAMTKPAPPAPSTAPAPATSTGG